MVVLAKLDAHFVVTFRHPQWTTWVIAWEKFCIHRSHLRVLISAYSVLKNVLGSSTVFAPSNASKIH